MDQARQEAAIQNARQLIEVGTPSIVHLPTILVLLSLHIPVTVETLFKLPNFTSETQRTLFRKVHSNTRRQPKQKRADLLHKLHGKVHGGVEYG
jgi:hypothetical protein